MPPEEDHRVDVHIDRLAAERGMTLTAVADQVGITLANLSVLKNGRARAVRFSTLTALCDVLSCQPGDLFSVRPAVGDPGAGGSPGPDDQGSAGRIGSRR